MKHLIKILFLIFALVFIGQASASVQVVASDTVQASNDTQYLISCVDFWCDASTLTLSENLTGTIRISYDSKGASTIYTNIFKNDIAVGTQRYNTEGGIWTTYTEDISISLLTSDKLSINASSTGYVRNFRLMYDYNYIPAVHGYVLYSNGTGISGAKVMVAGNTTITDSEGFYNINQSGIRCYSSALCGYPVAAGMSGYDANASFSNGQNETNINLTLSVSGVQNTNMFFNDSQKMFDYFTPNFNATGHIYTSDFDLNDSTYGEAMYSDIGAKMYNSSYNRSVEMLFYSVNALNHVTHDVIRTGDPHPPHELNLTLCPEWVDTTVMEFNMAFSTDAMKNLRPHVDTTLFNDWNTTLQTFNYSTYQVPESGNDQTSVLGNWGLIQMKAENYRCELGNQTACQKVSNISLKYSNQVTANGWLPAEPSSIYSVFASYWAREIIKDGYINQSFQNASNRSMNFVKSIQTKDGEIIQSGRSSGHTWNLGQLVALGFLQTGTDKGEWYRRADLAYSKINQYKYGNSGAYYIIRNYYDPSIRLGYANYSSWQGYNLLTGYFITRAGQLYDSSVTESPITFTNLNDFNASGALYSDSGLGILHFGKYSVYLNAIYLASGWGYTGYNNNSNTIPLRFIVTFENAANATIYPNPQDTTTSEKLNTSDDDEYMFDYFNGGSNRITLSTVNRTNTTIGVGNSTIWQNVTNLTFGAFPVSYINKSATVTGDIIHFKSIYGGIDGRLTNIRTHLNTLINDNRSQAVKSINGLRFNYSKGNESFNITNVTLTGGSGVAITNSAFDGYGEFGHHNSTLIYGTTTAASSHWGFDEGTSITVSDSNTTSSKTGTAGGSGFGWASGVHGSSGNFTGNAMIDVNSGATLSYMPQMYFASWERFTTVTSTVSTIFSNWAASGNMSYLLRVQTNTNPMTFNIVLKNVSGGTSNVQYSYPNGFNASDGQWHFIEVVYNGSYISFFVDRVQSPTVTAWSGIIQSSSTDTYIGCSPHSCTNTGWYGQIDDVYLYPYIPSSTERNAIMNNEVILEYDFQGQTNNVYGYQMTQLPAVQSYSPETPVVNNVSESRTFTVTFTKVVNVTWYINDTIVQTNNSVSSASYTNSSAVLGNWLVNATGINDYGSATQLWDWQVSQESVPPESITSPQTTTGNFFINNTWTDTTDIDFDHVSFYYANGTWLENVTSGVQYLNKTYSPHYTQNISAQTVDVTGNMNTTKVWFNVTIPNNAIVISGVNTSYSLTEGQYLLIDANYTDSDSDTGTFSDNATEWDVNTSTGIVNWTAVIGSYSWNISVTDGYGSTSIQNFTVQVNSSTYIPPSPINLTNTTGNFWVNYTWLPGTPGNITDSYNVSITNNSIQGWANGTQTFLNSTLAAHQWSNISVYSFNNSGTGTLNQTPVSANTQIQNNAPIQTSIGNKNVNEGSWLNFTISSTDVDEDSLIYGTNASKGTLTTNSYSWLTTYSNSGVYTWYFNTTDNYSAVATETITVTVNNVNQIPPAPVIDTVTTGNFWVNLTWTAGSGNITDGYNSTNGTTWVNNTLTYRNTTLSAHAWQNLTIYAWNSTDNVLSSTPLTNNTQIPNNVPIMNSIGAKSGNEGTWINFSITGTDTDSDSLTCSSNNTKGTLSNCNFNWSTGYTDAGIYNWGFYLNDSYSGSDYEDVTVTVNEMNFTSNITEWANNINGANQTALTLNVGNSVTFNVTVNQTVTNVSWKIGAEVQNTSSLEYIKLFDTVGVFNVTAQAFNVNGSSNIIYTVVTVQSTGGGGTVHHYAYGYVNWSNGTMVNTATVSTSEGNEYTDASGYYEYGYVFHEGSIYNFNVSKSGIWDNKTITFDDDELVNFTLAVSESPAGLPNITSWSNDNTSNANITLSVQKNTNITFNVTVNQTVTTTWTGTASPTKINETHAFKNFTTTGTFTVIASCSNANGSCLNSVTWTITVAGVGNLTVSGYVNNSLSAYLKDARVDFNESFVLTDSNGYYLFSDINEGTYTVVARAIGYRNSTRSTTIDSDTVMNFTMSERKTPVKAPGFNIVLLFISLLSIHLYMKRGK